MSDPTVVELPARGDGSRRGRRPPHRRLRIGLLVVVVVAASIAGVLGWSAVRGEPATVAPARPAHLAVGTDVDLVVQRDAGGGLQALTVLVVRHAGGGGVLDVPLATLAQADGDASTRLDHQPDATAVASALGGVFAHGVDQVVELAPGELGASSWPVWLRSARRAGPAPLVAAGALLSRGSVSFDSLPGDAVPAGFQVRTDDLDRLLVSLGVAGSVSPLRVQVLNGTGQAGRSQVVQPLLTKAKLNARVVLTGDADAAAGPTTRVVYYDAREADAARAVQRAIGAGEVDRSPVSVDAIDVTVILGGDFPPIAGG